mmetsp:Transcript_83190/g.258809  ORF Transcript_83190/g.258809 Transcript_83190/m.258809 type:complete len:219 (+) Transcript_83190:326-982(+)
MLERNCSHWGEAFLWRTPASSTLPTSKTQILLGMPSRRTRATGIQISMHRGLTGSHTLTLPCATLPALVVVAGAGPGAQPVARTIGSTLALILVLLVGRGPAPELWLATGLACVATAGPDATCLATSSAAAALAIPALLVTIVVVAVAAVAVLTVGGVATLAPSVGGAGALVPGGSGSPVVGAAAVRAHGAALVLLLPLRLPSRCRAVGGGTLFRCCS